MKPINNYANSFVRTQYEDISYNFTGISKVEARYVQSFDITIRGNRLIEALPPMRSWQQCHLDFESIPYWTPDIRKESVMIRSQMLNHLSEFRIARDFTSDVDMDIYSAIVRCYMKRVPVDVPGGNEENTGFYRIKKDTVPGVLILGDSGAGKTTAVEHALSYIPQLIIHEMDDSRMYQIPYINVVCPPDGSVKNFFDLCIEEIERITGISSVAKRHISTADDKSKVFRKLAMRFNLGLVVVDEIQNLLTAKNKIILNHFLILSNELSIPFVFVGTNNIAPYLHESPFFTQRRIGSEIHVERFKKDMMWDAFIKRLWKFQWMKDEIPLTEEFSDLFYKESGGIIDRAMELYRNAQKRAIKMGMDTKECFTPAFVHNISSKDFSLSYGGLNILAEEGPMTLKKIPCDLRHGLDEQKLLNEKEQLSFHEQSVKYDSLLADSPKSRLDAVKFNVIENVGSFCKGMFTIHQIDKAFNKLQKELNVLAVDETELSMNVFKCLMEAHDTVAEMVDQKTVHQRKKTKTVICAGDLPVFEGFGALK